MIVHSLIMNLILENKIIQLKESITVLDTKS